MPDILPLHYALDAENLLNRIRSEWGASDPMNPARYYIEEEIEKVIERRLDRLFTMKSPKRSVNYFLRMAKEQPDRVASRFDQLVAARFFIMELNGELPGQSPFPMFEDRPEGTPDHV